MKIFLLAIKFIIFIKNFPAFAKIYQLNNKILKKVYIKFYAKFFNSPLYYNYILNIMNYRLNFNFNY